MYLFSLFYLFIFHFFTQLNVTDLSWYKQLHLLGAKFNTFSMFKPFFLLPVTFCLLAVGYCTFFKRKKNKARGTSLGVFFFFKIHCKRFCSKLFKSCHAKRYSSHSSTPTRLDVESSSGTPDTWIPACFPHRDTATPSLLFLYLCCRCCLLPKSTKTPEALWQVKKDKKKERERRDWLVLFPVECSSDVL